MPTTDEELIEALAVYLRYEWSIGMMKGRIIARDVIAIVRGETEYLNAISTNRRPASNGQSQG